MEWNSFPFLFPSSPHDLDPLFLGLLVSLFLSLLPLIHTLSYFLSLSVLYTLLQLSLIHAYLLQTQHNTTQPTNLPTSPPQHKP